MNNILILTTVHPIDDARIFYKEALSLKKKFKSISFMVPTDNMEVFTKESIKIIPLHKSNSRFNRVIKLQFEAFLKILKNNFDIVHIHDPELILLAFILKKALKKKIIFDVHENVLQSITVREWIPKYLKKLYAWIYIKMETFLISDFDEIIIAEKSYRKIYGSRAIEILNYPVFNKSENITKDFSSSINFVYSGSISEVRGIWQILKFFNRIYRTNKNAKLHIIGKFSNDILEKDVLEFLTLNNLTNIVKVYGRLTIPELYKILTNCHVGFAILKPVKHHTEKVIGKIFDYMHFGIPVIVSDFKIYDEYVIKANTGITIDYNNLELSSKKIIALLNNPSLLSMMSTNGIKYVLSGWNWQTQEEKLLALYEQLLTN